MTAHFKTYCIIGDPIDHSLSPAIHNAAFTTLGLNCSYIAFRVQEGQLKNSMDSLRAINIGGFNVTMPHKVTVLNYVDRHDMIVELVGAANTVNNEGGKFSAYNTDVVGFIEPLHQRKIDLNGYEVLIWELEELQEQWQLHSIKKKEFPRSIYSIGILIDPQI